MSLFRLFIGVTIMYWTIFAGLFILVGTVVHFAFGLSWYGVVVSAMGFALIAALFKTVTADYSGTEYWLD